MRRLPPLNALRVFEVAARTSSYAMAASELGLTHGAVSRQIAILETWLGQRLFVRVGRRMMATPAAGAMPSGKIPGSGGRLPAVSRVARVNSRIACWVEVMA